jgi:hypothetical protein
MKPRIFSGHVYSEAVDKLTTRAYRKRSIIKNLTRMILKIKYYIKPIQ